MNGEPDHDLIETDPDRYNGSKGRAAWADRTFLMKKARESYGMNNSPIFPKEERWAGRPTSRVSGAYEATKDRGAGRYCRFLQEISFTFIIGVFGNDCIIEQSGRPAGIGTFEIWDQRPQSP